MRWKKSETIQQMTLLQVLYSLCGRDWQKNVFLEEVEAAAEEEYVQY